MVCKYKGHERQQNQGYVIYLFPVQINGEAGNDYLDDPSDLESSAFTLAGDGARVMPVSSGTWPDIHVGSQESTPVIRINRNLIQGNDAFFGMFDVSGRKIADMPFIHLEQAVNRWRLRPGAYIIIPSGANRKNIQKIIK